MRSGPPLPFELDSNLTRRGGPRWIAARWRCRGVNEIGVDSDSGTLKRPHSRISTRARKSRSRWMDGIGLSGAGTVQSAGSRRDEAGSKRAEMRADGHFGEGPAAARGRYAARERRGSRPPARGGPGKSTKCSDRAFAYISFKRLHPCAGTDVCKRAFAAARLAGVADLAAEHDPLVVDVVPVLAGQDLEEVLLRFERFVGMRFG